MLAWGIEVIRLVCTQFNESEVFLRVNYYKIMRLGGLETDTDKLAELEFATSHP